MPHHHQQGPGHGRGHDHGQRHGIMSQSPESYERKARLLGWLVYGRVTRDVARAGLPPTARILDVGTGPGLLPLRIAARLPQVTIDAVDLDPGMVARATQNAARYPGRITATAADVTALPFPDGSFDLAISTLSLHHWEDPAAGVRELVRVLRPGGRLYVYDLRRVLGAAVEAGRAAGGQVQVRVRPLDPLGRVEITAR